MSTPTSPQALPVTLTLAEETQLLAAFNDTFADYPRTETMVSLFEDQVQRTPDHPALLWQQESLSYRQLLARVNQLAHYLQRCGVGPQVLVGVCLPRTPELVISLLAILKAGGAKPRKP